MTEEILSTGKEKKESSKYEKTLGYKLAGIRAAFQGIVVPIGLYTMAALSKPFTGVNLEEMTNSPHFWLSGLYVWAGDTSLAIALCLGIEAKKAVDRRRYSPEVVDLEDQLLEAGKDRRTEDFDGLVEKLKQAFEDCGKEGEQRIKGKQNRAYNLALRVTKARLKKITKAGDLDALEEEWRVRDRLVEERYGPIGAQAYNMISPSFEKFEKKCAKVYVKKQLAELDANLDGFSTNLSRRLARKNGIDYGFFALRMDYDRLKQKINRLKSVSELAGEYEVAQVKYFEHQFNVLELLNRGLAEIYDLAGKEKNLSAVERKLAEIKPSLKYDESVIDEAFRKIVKLATPKQKGWSLIGEEMK